MKPRLVMLAGPNGAGKSTFYDELLRDSSLPFLNADVLAEEIGIDSFEAARILDASRERLVDDGIGFITETVFSDPYGHKLGLLRRAVACGYEVQLIYIGVGRTELLHHRVDHRAAGGGHNVPHERIASRFARSLENLQAAIAIASSTQLYDNSSSRRPFEHLATWEHGELIVRAARIPAWARRVVGPRPRR